LGLRGNTDARIIELLGAAEADIVLLTQDTEFEHVPLAGGKVLISRVPQNPTIESRIEVWLRPSVSSSVRYESIGNSERSCGPTKPTSIRMCSMREL
jgi:hypothetical protein